MSAFINKKMIKRIINYLYYLNKRQNNTYISHLLIFYFGFILTLYVQKKQWTQTLSHIFLFAEVKKV